MLSRRKLLNGLAAGACVVGAGCVGLVLVNALTAFQGKAFETPKRRAVSGISCINPRAPLGDTACGL